MGNTPANGSHITHLRITDQISCFSIHRDLTFYQFRIKQIKKLFAVRSKISQDLHDEVGATLTSISYLSEVAKLKSYTENIQSNEALEKIGEFSREMIGEMNDIVWAINPDNDHFEKIESRMRNFASVLFSSRNINLHFHSDEGIMRCNLGMQQRKNLFLIFKEAVNNAAKYSGSNNVYVSLYKYNGHLYLEVKDEGKGFDIGEASLGNGLKNMKSRSKEISANLEITTDQGKGTKVSLKLPITQNAY